MMLAITKGGTMRKVLRNSEEVAHYWANGVQDQGRNAGDSVSFDRSLFWSYGTPIARKIMNKKGERAFLVASRHYSATTSKHLSYVRQAIPGGERVFSVREVDRGGWNNNGFEPKAALENYLQQIADAELSRSRARTERMRDMYALELDGLQNTVTKFCAFFGLRCPKLDPVAAAAKLARIRKAAAKHDREVKAARAKAMEGLAESWRNGGHDWDPTLGSIRQYPHILLRREGEEVATSRGARVPLDHAERLYRLWTAREAKAGTRVGVYTVSAVNGSMTIGCHVIEREEADRFAVAMGWN